jgi:RHH-type transcriptional regulator, proline utilization regulon repressor / proline dehydrogenase / delta 1-pyrroline-5-carboxylate dehydrogenase
MVTAQPTVIDCDSADRSYRAAWAQWFSCGHDPTGLTSERNELRYRALDAVLIRVGAETPDGALAAARNAAEICGTRVTISDAASESEEALIERLGEVGADRVRLLTSATDALRTACRSQGIEVDTEPVSISGRRELRRWLREQAISRTTHRHGRVAP